MAKISELPAAGPINGSEKTIFLQDGVAVQGDLDALADTTTTLDEVLDPSGAEYIRISTPDGPKKLSLFNLSTYLGASPTAPAPVFDVAPSISGTAMEGETLTGADGTIRFGTVVGRAWLRNGSAISGASGSTYLLVSADVGANISFRVTATGEGGSTNGTSAPVGPVDASPVPSWTVDPYITGTASIGQTLVGSDGTLVNGTVSARQWLRNGVAISGATGSTYVLVSADIGTTITFRVTASNTGGSASATSLGAGPVSGFALPTLSTAKYDGDSRTQGMGSRAVSGGGLTISNGLGSVGSTALIQAVCGNKWLLGEGYLHAIGGSTTLAQEERSKSTSIASTGNPALATTGMASDAKYSDLSDGAASILTQAGNHIISASVGVNDNGGTAAAYYNSPSTAWQTLRTIARLADAIGTAGKVWYVGNEFPRGDAYYTMESRTVSGGTCTAANTTNFKDGESFGAVGAIGVFGTGIHRPLTKVSSAPGQDQYTVTSGGLYTFGGTAPTTVFLNYNASPSGGRNATYDQLRIIREFMMSEAANFVSAINGVDYGIPGLRYQRPWVRIADTFGALVDPSTGAAQLPLPGTSDILQLHGLTLNSYKTALAFKAVLDADYPSAPDLSRAPTRNNWYSALGNGATTAFSGTLPPTMRTGFTGTPAPTLISINGAPIGKVDTSTGAITGTGITAGTLNFSTGAWSITFDATSRMPSGAQLWFEQDIGNYNLATMTEGTIGRNAVNNPLMDMTPASGTNLSTTTGTSSVTGVAGSSVPYGWLLSSSPLNTAIAAGTATISVGSVTDGNGYPMFYADISSTDGAALLPVLGSSTLNNFSQRVTAGDKIAAGAMTRYAKHGTVGKLYGCNGLRITSTFTTAAVSRNSPTGTQSITQMVTRVNDVGTGLYVDQQVTDAAGGSLDLYRMAALLDTTGCTFASPSLNLQIGSTTGGVPAAYRVGFGRAQIRRRNDVA